MSRIDKCTEIESRLRLGGRCWGRQGSEFWGGAGAACCINENVTDCAGSCKTLLIFQKTTELYTL